MAENQSPNPTLEYQEVEKEHTPITPADIAEGKKILTQSDNPEITKELNGPTNEATEELGALKNETFLNREQLRPENAPIIGVEKNEETLWSIFLNNHEYLLKVVQKANRKRGWHGRPHEQLGKNRSSKQLDSIISMLCEKNKETRKKFKDTILLIQEYKELKKEAKKEIFSINKALMRDNGTEYNNGVALEYKGKDVTAWLLRANKEVFQEQLQRLENKISSQCKTTVEVFKNNGIKEVQLGNLYVFSENNRDIKEYQKNNRNVEKKLENLSEKHPLIRLDFIKDFAGYMADLNYDSDSQDKNFFHENLLANTLVNAMYHNEEEFIKGIKYIIEYAGAPKGVNFNLDSINSIEQLCAYFIKNPGVIAQVHSGLKYINAGILDLNDVLLSGGDIPHLLEARFDKNTEYINEISNGIEGVVSWKILTCIDIMIKREDNDGEKKRLMALKEDLGEYPRMISMEFAGMFASRINGESDFWAGVSMRSEYTKAIEEYIDADLVFDMGITDKNGFVISPRLTKELDSREFGNIFWSEEKTSKILPGKTDLIANIASLSLIQSFQTNKEVLLREVLKGDTWLKSVYAGGIYSPYSGSVVGVSESKAQALEEKHETRVSLFRKINSPEKVENVNSKIFYTAFKEELNKYDHLTEKAKKLCLPPEDEVQDFVNELKDFLERRNYDNSENKELSFKEAVMEFLSVQHLNEIETAQKKGYRISDLMAWFLSTGIFFVGIAAATVVHELEPNIKKTDKRLKDMGGNPDKYVREGFLGFDNFKADVEKIENAVDITGSALEIRESEENPDNIILVSDFIRFGEGVDIGELNIQGKKGKTYLEIPKNTSLHIARSGEGKKIGIRILALKSNGEWEIKVCQPGIEGYVSHAWERKIGVGIAFDGKGTGNKKENKVPDNSDQEDFTGGDQGGGTVENWTNTSGGQNPGGSGNPVWGGNSEGI